MVNYIRSVSFWYYGVMLYVYVRRYLVGLNSTYSGKNMRCNELGKNLSEYVYDMLKYYLLYRQTNVGPQGLWYVT